MSSKRGGWITRRGQTGAGAAIELVLDQQPQPGEQVQFIADDQIEDSPYQARQPITTASVADLAQGMREAGFQGVLIVRPHSDRGKRARGVYQLVYGHRRRVAWRSVCTERSEPCLMPAVVREISDAHLLTIGAQENLQRQDLDPVEEAQIVAWHERMFFEKNQAEIGALLGKSSDWVSVRSRIHKLPDALKACLRQRPRAIKQLLELGILYTQQPDRAVALAERVVHEYLTVEAMRGILNEPPAKIPAPTREIRNNHRAGAISVQGVTSPASAGASTGPNESPYETAQPEAVPAMHSVLGDATTASERQSLTDPFDSASLHAVATTLATLASHADEIASDPATLQHVEIAAQALEVIRRAFIRRTLPSTVLSRSHPYRLLNAELSDLVLMLRQHHAALALLSPAQGTGRALHLMIGRAPTDVRGAGSARQSYTLFAATPIGGSAVVPATTADLRDWARHHLKLPQHEAVMAIGLVRDLQEIFGEV